MPLYHVKHGASAVLVKADTSAQAVRHVAQSMISAEVVTSPVEAADLVARGLKLETANTTQTQQPAAVAYDYMGEDGA